MINDLATEGSNPDSVNLDLLSTIDLVHLINAEDAKVAQAVAAESESIARAIDIIAKRLEEGGRLIYVGAGTSGRLGILDAAECPPTFSCAPGQVVALIAGGPGAVLQAVEGAEDSTEQGKIDLAALRQCTRSGNDRLQLQSGCGDSNSCGSGHPAAGRSRSVVGFNANESGHRHQARIEHVDYRGDGPPRQGLR